MKDLSLLTWKEIKELDKDKSIVSVVLAPIEEHGWHLPLATDLLEGEHWSRGALARAEEELDAGCFYLPAFPVASASVNESQPLMSRRPSFQAVTDGTDNPS